MRRRRYLATVAGWFGLSTLAGCLNALPGVGDNSPEYPGGSLVIENTAEASFQVAVEVVEEEWPASLRTSVSGGETLVRREFVTASEGDVVTLAAILGGEGEQTTFEFLPAGGEADAPPEVAHLTVQNDVEGSARWIATPGY